MIVVALAAVSLHCSLTEWDYFPNKATGGPFAAQVYVDYDRGYGYLKIAHRETPGEVESERVLITDRNIRFLSGNFGINAIEDAEIDRATGLFTLRLKTPLGSPGTYLDFRGTCEAGEPIALPEHPRPRF